MKGGKDTEGALKDIEDNPVGKLDNVDIEGERMFSDIGVRGSSVGRSGVSEGQLSVDEGGPISGAVHVPV